MSKFDADPPEAPEAPEALEVEDPGEPNFAQVFFPARPKALRPRARLRQQGAPSRAQVRSGEPEGSNPVYVDWLCGQSMLQDAKEIANQFSGLGSMWQNPFAQPDPRAAVQTASVWFTAYPISLITRKRESFLAALGSDELWQAFQTIGIDAVHTGPVKRAGGITGWRETPSVDGHFDRVSTHIDPVFGQEEEFRRWVADRFRLDELGAMEVTGEFPMLRVVSPLD